VQSEHLANNKSHLLVLGNEKGGSGKSTTAMHVVAALMADGRSVGAIDLDSRQRSLSRYLENRRAFAQGTGLGLELPGHWLLDPASQDSTAAARAEENERFEMTLAAASAAHEFVVIDCPGSDTHLSRLAHACADTLITPLNDSFVDLDLLARIDRDSYEIEGPSLYAEMVWDARKRRAMTDRGHIDWIVMRNRVSALKARNKARIERTLTDLARRIGFRYAAGFSERVIYRELFPKGLTLVDLRLPGVRERLGAMTMSQVAARQELRRLIDSLSLPAPAMIRQAAE